MSFVVRRVVVERIAITINSAVTARTTGALLESVSYSLGNSALKVVLSPPNGPDDGPLNAVIFLRSSPAAEFDLVHCLNSRGVCRVSLPLSLSL